MAELNNPRKAPNDGKIKMPSVQAGMNKRGPMMGKGDKKAYDDDEWGDDWKPLGTEKRKEEETHDEVLERARKRMTRCIDSESDNRKAALEDLKFKRGEQWPADVAAQRNTDKRPCLTINKMQTFVHQITNDQRQNRPAINVSPVGDRSDPDAAKVYRGLIRAIERESTADIAYDTAFESAVSNGFGYFRIRTDWEAPDSFDQVIKIERIRNPFTVYLDPDHQEPDGADCKYAFVTEMIPMDEFKAQYPDADTEAYDQGGIGDKYKEWSSKDGIRIAEYFETKIDMEDLVKLSNGYVGWKDDLAQRTKDMIKSGALEIVDERKSEKRKIKWYKITATEVLEESEWLGLWIPIIPVIGEEIDIEGKVFYSGVIRNAKDPQRMYNYWKTSETELIALAPKAPWIVEEGQIEGYEEQWRSANVRNYPYLPYRGVSLGGTLAPPPQRQQFAGVPAGVVQAAQGAAQDMMATTGIRFDASPNERMMDESGRAIRELRRSGDLGSFHYMDNLARSLKHCGRQLIDLIPKIYDTKRQITILREDDKEEKVVIDPSANLPYQEQPGPNGKKMKVFNPTIGKFGVTVDIGPSYASKRIEASESMMDFVRAMPQTGQLVADLIAKNQDWPGAEEMATRLAKAVPANLMGQDMKDIPPQVQAAINNMQQELKAAQAQLQQAAFQLNDKQKDRDIMMAKINADFEVKLMAIIQKAEDSMNKQVGSKIEDLAQGVAQLMSALPKPQSGGQTEGMMNAGSTRNDDGSNPQGGASDVSDLGLPPVQG